MIPTGRFAPTPSGPLHFGSVIAALASYLNIKQQHGRWLLRIDDIDTPRIAKGATDKILNALEFLGFEWDESIYYQSEHLDDYHTALEKLTESKLIYRCTCTRKEIGNIVYTAKCRNANHNTEQQHSLRIKTDNTAITVNDLLQGVFTQQLFKDVGDFIVKRSDKIVSYHLSTVIDDHLQSITEIVRGYDLLESTPRHIYLRGCLNLKNPNYLHLPLAMKNTKDKLSKQTHAKAIEKDEASQTLFNALDFLDQSPDKQLINANPKELLAWGLEHWNHKNIPKQTSILVQ